MKAFSLEIEDSKKQPEEEVLEGMQEDVYTIGNTDFTSSACPEVSGVICTIVGRVAFQIRIVVHQLLHDRQEFVSGYVGVERALQFRGVMASTSA